MTEAERSWWLIVAIMLAVLGVLLIVTDPVSGAKPTSGLTLISESISQPNPGPVRPLDCWNEDDRHERYWEGQLGPGASYTFTERFCDRDVDGANSGGEGLFVAAGARGDLTVFVRQPSPQGQDGLNWPDPPYPFPDVPMLPMEQWGRGAGAVCIVPLFHASGGSVGPLEGGTYQIVVRNDTGRTLRTASVEVTVRMAHAFWQEELCPVEYRNVD